MRRSTTASHQQVGSEAGVAQSRGGHMVCRAAQQSSSSQRVPADFSQRSTKHTSECWFGDRYRVVRVGRNTGLDLLCLCQWYGNDISELRRGISWLRIFVAAVQPYLKGSAWNMLQSSLLPWSFPKLGENEVSAAKTLTALSKAEALGFHTYSYLASISHVTCQDAIAPLNAWRARFQLQLKV